MKQLECDEFSNLWLKGADVAFIQLVRSSSLQILYLYDPPWPSTGNRNRALPKWPPECVRGKLSFPKTVAKALTFMLTTWRPWNYDLVSLTASVSLYTRCWLWCSFIICQLKRGRRRKDVAVFMLFRCFAVEVSTKTTWNRKSFSHKSSSFLVAFWSVWL